MTASILQFPGPRTAPDVGCDACYHMGFLWCFKKKVRCTVCKGRGWDGDGGQVA